MKIKSIALSMVALCGCLTLSAEVTQYEEMYLRGSFEGADWTTNNFKFDRQNDIYSITVNKLVGEFKITNNDWSYNFGGSEQNVNVNGDMELTGINNGPNFIGNCNTPLTISFIYDGKSSTRIKFSTTGEIIKPAGPVDLTSGTLPVLHINVYNENGNFNNEIIDKDLSHKNYFSGNYWLDLNGCTWMDGATNLGSEEEPLPLEIKARGNWTRKGFSKKPFKLKLGKKQSMLGMTKSKHYAIIAHADDNFGYLRNFTGFNLGKRIGLPWTPSQQPIEVIINGDYRGLYFLTESIRVGDDRVMITELGDNETEAALISGGYLVELDNYDEENQIRMEEKGLAGGFRDMLRITFDTPEIYSDLQRRFINDQFSTMNDLVGENSDDLWSYIDLDDAARYYIVEEIISHTESYHGSTYLFRDRGEDQKWHFSPLWDCGNAFNGPTDDFFYNHGPFGNTWIATFRMNDMFNEKVKQTWRWFMSKQYNGIETDIENYVNSINAAAQSDYNRWNNAPTPSFEGSQPVIDNRNMSEKMSAVKSHLNSKINWLKNQFGEFNNGFFTEPERDDTQAAPLPDYAKGPSTIAEFIVDEPETDAEYYNMQGMKVSAPVKGVPYIVIRNGKATKSIK